MRSLSLSPSHGRRGFTLVELLVVIAIIGMLVALLVPAVNSARATARKNTCLSNMQQLGKGVINYETNKQRLPGYVEPVKAVGNSGIGYVEWVPTNSDPQFVDSISRLVTGTNQKEAKLRSQISWAAHLLPFVDRNELWDNLQKADASAEQRRVVPIDFFICPDDTDIRSTANAAGLSYIVNTGAWDFEPNSNEFHGPSENGDTKDNGLFHNRVHGNVTTRMSDIQDGQSTTLMISENVHKNPTYSWLGVAYENPGEQQLGMVWVVNPRPESRCDGNDHQYNFKAEPDVLNFFENSPCFARPYAIHSSTFNVIFADGHGTALSPDIDYMVYQQILTPRGSKCVDPHAKPVSNDNQLSNAIKEFRSRRPVSDADLSP
jgi:prepilin-type N-terminal cleavage/methylation domain-containing protein/prepilin-type processing-associated H-X9-DG protein